MNNNKKPMGLLRMRQTGPIKPTKPINNEEVNNKNVTNTKLKSKSKRKSTSFANQKKSIKMSGDSYRELKIIKNMENMTFDYEVIQLLMDTYYHNLSSTDKKTFDVLRDNLR